MKKMFAVMAVAMIAIFAMAGTAGAAYNALFSKNLSDWGGAFEKDGAKVKFVIEGRLVSGKTYSDTDLKAFKDNSAYSGAWSSLAGWDTIKEDKFGLILWSPASPAGHKILPVPVDCEKTGDATSTAGEQFRCTQKTGADLGINDNELMALSNYVYVILLSANVINTSPNKTITWTIPLNVAALVNKGLSAEPAADADGDLVTDDLDQCADTPSGATVETEGDYAGCSAEQKAAKIAACDDATGDCDNDGVVGTADKCPEEAGTGTDGCPASADTTTPVGDGGGCSMAPLAAPNVIGLLVLAAAMIPLAFRRRR